MSFEFVREIDLVHLIESDLGAGVDTGKWKKFLCPFCRHLQRELKTFLLATNTGAKGFWFCKFCNRKGDALAWLKDYRRMSTESALAYLRGPYVKFRNAREVMPAAE
jgi:hypothetical protein